MYLSVIITLVVVVVVVVCIMYYVLFARYALTYYSFGRPSARRPSRSAAARSDMGYKGLYYKIRGYCIHVYVHIHIYIYIYREREMGIYKVGYNI